MESFFIIPFLTLLATIFVIGIIHKTMINSKTTHPGRVEKTPPLPPGPWKLPIIGNLLQMMGKDYQLPHRRLRYLAGKHGPLMHLQLGQTPTVVVSSPELAREFMKTHDLHFASRPFIRSISIIFYDSKNIAMSPYGEYWRQMRRICTQELVSPARVRSLRPIREEEVRKTVEIIISSTAENGTKTVNLTRTIAALTNTFICRAAFGKIQKQEDVFLPLMEHMMKMVGGLSIGDIFPSSKLATLLSIATVRKLTSLHKEMDVILEGIIRDHIAARSTGHKQAADHQDLVDVLLNFTDNQDLGFPFSNIQIKGVIMDLFVGGADTTSVPIEWAMAELMKNPRVMEKAQREVRQVFDEKRKVDEEDLHQLHYLNLVIKESFRMHTPAPLLGPRECRETTVVDGYTIPAKTRVIINAWAIGRDPRYWAEPERFYPERFLESSVDYRGLDFELIPFGAGRRGCMGIGFGMAVVELLLANLLYHFDWKLPDMANPEELDMSEVFGLAMKRKDDLILIPIPYNTS